MSTDKEMLDFLQRYYVEISFETDQHNNDSWAVDCGSRIHEGKVIALIFYGETLRLAIKQAMKHMLT